MAGDRVRQLRLVQRAFRSALMGFRHQGLRSWRERADGIVEIVEFYSLPDFPSEPFGVKAASLVTGLSEARIRKVAPRGASFVVDVGIWVPEIGPYLYPPTQCKIPPNVSMCPWRTELHRQDAGDHDPFGGQFTVGADPDTSAQPVLDAWRREGQQFLESIPDREFLVRSYFSSTAGYGETARATLVLLALQRRMREARLLLKRERAAARHSGYVEAMRELAVRVGVVRRRSTSGARKRGAPRRSRRRPPPAAR